MALFFRGIPFREVRRGSPKESGGPDQQSATRTVWVPWIQRHEFIRQALGYSEVVPAPAALGLHGQISRVIPWRHPDHPNLYAEAYTLEGEVPEGVDAGEMGTFDEAKIEFRYAQPRYRVLTDEEVTVDDEIAEWQLLRYVTVTETPSAKYQTVPSTAALRWTSDNTPMSTTSTIPLFQSDVTIVWEQVPTAAFEGTFSSSAAGSCNSADFGHGQSFLGTKSTQTLVFGTAGKEVYRHNGEWYYRLSMKFRWHPFGANFFYRFNAPTLGFALATRNGVAGGPRMFPPLDFKNLFRVGV